MKHLATIVLLFTSLVALSSAKFETRTLLAPAILSLPNITTGTGAMSFIPAPILANATAFEAQRNLSATAPFEALFDGADRYRQQFDAEREGNFFQHLPALEPALKGPGGTIKLWNIQNAALYGQSASQALVEFEPCGLNLPHVHPRGLEFIHVLYGNITITMVEENYGRAISHRLGAGDSMFIPAGLVHAEHNLGCEPAAFMNTFTSTDPGLSTVHTALLQFPKDTIIAAMGNVEESVVDMLLAKQPTSLAQGPPSCMRKCGF